MLKLDSVSINFAGVQAVDKVSFELAPNSITTIIGPNGAGKTTLFNLISGFHRPTEGKISFDGVDITRLPTYKRVRLRMGRSFQITNLFPDLTVSAHLVVAATRESIWKLTSSSEERVREVLQELGLWHQRDVLCKDLTVPDQKKLDFAVMLTQRPKLLLLDEPFASLAPEQIEELAGIVVEMGKERTVLLVEHRMDVVMKLAHRIIVMARGAVIADGTPNEIRRNELVQKVYLKEVT
ncbi:MAG: ABC transporter ATP-binding protein [Desulfobacterales bacterium]|jgi:branched-chain amino acid transport system ATP-binding protein|nr:ABC transporter ATP-binding protein [Desulfobacterales bacterium]